MAIRGFPRPLPRNPKPEPASTAPTVASPSVADDLDGYERKWALSATHVAESAPVAYVDPDTVPERRPEDLEYAAAEREHDDAPVMTRPLAPPPRPQRVALDPEAGLRPEPRPDPTSMRVPGRPAFPRPPDAAPAPSSSPPSRPLPPRPSFGAVRPAPTAPAAQASTPPKRPPVKPTLGPDDIPF